jgi:adenylate kinase family enzyme
VKRIVVLGIPGAGKSTLARQLGETIGLPVYHLDRYFWNPGWVATPRDEFNARLQELLLGHQWVIDGNYSRTISTRLQRADTAIYLQLPRRRALWRVLKRAMMYRNGTRPDMADGCTERFPDAEFLRHIWRYERNVHPEVVRHLDRFEQGGGVVVRLRDSRETEQWLEHIIQEKRGGKSAAQP